MNIIRVRGLALLATVSPISESSRAEVAITLRAARQQLTQTARVAVAPTPTGTATDNRAVEAVKSGYTRVMGSVLNSFG